MHFNAALENTKQSLNNILMAKKEVEDKKVDKWKENQLKNIDKEMNDYSKFVNNIFSGNFKELKNKDINKDLNAN
jgi:glucan-binding YG repeat protein